MLRAARRDIITKTSESFQGEKVARHEEELGRRSL
jgi:hypothetical protein